MKTLIWVTFAVLAALWTGFIAMSAGMVGWLLSAVADGQIGQAAQTVAQWPVPAWLALWVDVGLLESLQVSARMTMGNLMWRERWSWYCVDR